MSGVLRKRGVPWTDDTQCFGAKSKLPTTLVGTINDVVAGEAAAMADRIAIIVTLVAFILRLKGKHTLCSHGGDPKGPAPQTRSVYAVSALRLLLSTRKYL